MTRSLLLLTALAFLGLTVNACTTETCEEGEERCVGEQVQSCVDGLWGDATDCDAGLSCGAMGDEEHCM